MLARLPLAGRMEILRQRLVAIPEQMGETLARTAYSANIKERRDHSCALFDERGALLAQAAHIPVHLGSMAASVAAARRAHADPAPGDLFLLNDPYSGGTHLPDITMISPVFADAARLLGFAASRAHHADVGGAWPGSMAAAESIHQEGLRIPPVRWCAAGVEQADLRELLLANVRMPEERLGDLRAQRAAHEVARRALVEVRARYADDEFAALTAALCDYAERRMRETIAAIPEGRYEFTDFLEGDGVGDALIPIHVALTLRGGEADVDFAGTSPAVAGCVNCPLTVTQAAVTYVFVCLAGPGLPHNAGMYRPIRVTAPPGCLVNARYPSAVAAGNVETSQRIVDALLGALTQAIPERIPAGSAGTMSSLSLGGVDPRSGRHFAYYETIAGGSGATAAWTGEPGIHTHMTNTRNTPIEALETAFPLRARHYGLSRGSGGGGAHFGGDGLVRELTALAPMSGAILADRHRRGPAGANHGLSGKTGGATILRSDGRMEPLSSKCSFQLNDGDTIRVVTPGGGGWGALQIADGE